MLHGQVCSTILHDTRLPLSEASVDLRDDADHSLRRSSLCVEDTVLLLGLDPPFDSFDVSEHDRGIAPDLRLSVLAPVIRVWLACRRNSGMSGSMLNMLARRRMGRTNDSLMSDRIDCSLLELSIVFRSAFQNEELSCPVESFFMLKTILLNIADNSCKSKFFFKMLSYRWSVSSEKSDKFSYTF